MRTSPGGCSTSPRLPVRIHSPREPSSFWPSTISFFFPLWQALGLTREWHGIKWVRVSHPVYTPMRVRFAPGWTPRYARPVFVSHLIFSKVLDIYFFSISLNFGSSFISSPSCTLQKIKNKTLFFYRSLLLSFVSVTFFFNIWIRLYVFYFV